MCFSLSDRLNVCRFSEKDFQCCSLQPGALSFPSVISVCCKILPRGLVSVLFMQKKGQIRTRRKSHSGRAPTAAAFAHSSNLNRFVLRERAPPLFPRTKDLVFMANHCIVFKVPFHQLNRACRWNHFLNRQEKR